MFNKRLLVIISTVGLLIALAFVASVGSANLIVSSQAVGPGSSVGQSSGEVPLAAVEASDYFQRHPESIQPGNAVDLSDYYLRHSGPGNAVGVGASDWFERYPEMVNAANAIDASDYFERHPGLLTPGNAPDLSDWFLRHPESVSR